VKHRLIWNYCFDGGIFTFYSSCPMRSRNQLKNVVLRSGQRLTRAQCQAKILPIIVCQLFCFSE